MWRILKIGGVAGLMVVAAADFTGSAGAQLGHLGTRGMLEQNLVRDIFPGDTFTFCRVMYRDDGRGWGWQTDYPDSDINFSLRLSELTTIKINTDDRGRPQHAIVRLTDEELFNYPFIYMLEVGNLWFSNEEAENLREYLQRGGFLLVDDFWGDVAWNNFAMEMEKVFPPDRYPESQIVDIPLDHELFHVVFDIDKVPQVPAINRYYYWKQTGDAYEGQPTTDPSPHCRGIFDKNGRLMAVIMHNTDLGDGWEREAEHPGYFEEFSVKRAYPMGINIVAYAMTH